MQRTTRDAFLLNELLVPLLLRQLDSYTVPQATPTIAYPYLRSEAGDHTSVGYPAWEEAGPGECTRKEATY